MVLKIDPANYQSLKIVISKEVTNNDVELVRDKNDKTERNVRTTGLPQLKLGQFLLFTENSICRYLFASTGKLQNADEVDKWLEWESLHLEPSLQSIINQVWGEVKSSNHDYTNKQLQHLNTHLQTNSFLVDDQFSLADIVVAVSIFPLIANAEVVNSYQKELPAILKWFERLKSTVPSLKEAILNCNIESVKDSFLAKRTIKQVSASDVSRSSDLGNPLPASNTDIEQETALSAKEIQEACDAWESGVDHCKFEKPSYPILPVDGKRNVLITSALPYVNNVPHLGNIIGCVLSADVFARFSRLRGYNTLYICGTDEYGTATETKALEEGVTPQQICDKYHKLHADIYKWFDISFDHFGRTTTAWQTKIAQDMFWRLHQHGYLLEDSVEQLLCTNCNRFLADRFVEGICPFCNYSDARGDQCDKCGKLINAVELKSPQCKICKATPIKKTSQHLFLDLPKLESLLSPWLEKSINDGVWTNSAKVICNSWIRDGLKPRCITRDLKWGTPVPLEGYTEKVFYVWYDAPIGYLSITANYTDKWEKWWKNPNQVELFQFMAKDNVPFHGVIFPCTQLGSNDNYTIVNSLVATEYLNYEDTKFSKSREIGVFGNDASETGIPADIYRFYLLFVRPESQDSSFSWIDLMTKNNSELLNNLGNFVNRTTTFVCNNFNGTVPSMNLKDEDKIFIAEVNRELNGYLAAMEKAKLRDGIRYILNISRRGNQYIQSNKPWVLLKGNPEEKACAGTLMGICLNTACLLSVMVQPYMPTISSHIQTQLNAPENCNILHSNFKCYLPAGHRIGTPAILFHKIEQADMEKFQKKFAGKQSDRDGETKETAVVDVQGCNNVVDKPHNTVDATLIEALKAAVTEQGDKVRSLKAKKAEKSELDAELAKLLELKAQLASSSGEEIPVSSSSKKGKKKGKK